jgi:hypothetical protein
VSQTKAQLLDGKSASVQFNSGSAAAPTVTFTGNTTTGLYLPAANELSVTTSGTERLRVDASGRVLVGTSTARTNFLSAGVTAQTQLEGTDANTTSFVITRNSVNSASSILGFAKSKGAAVGSNTIVIDGDQLGRINFAGSDGTSFILAAEIEARIDGTPGTNSMPGRIVLSTTASGASAPTERLRIDSSGRTLIGTTSALNVGSYSSGFEGFQVAGTTSAARASLSRWDASTADPGITLAKSRGGTVGTNGIVSSSDNIGRVEFTADDGTSFLTAARILAQVDGTPGTNDMPGRLIFSTTADGASTPTERLRINSNGFASYTGSIGRGAPVTKTGNFTVGIAENWLICNGTGTITVTLPTASAWIGREIMIKTIAAFTVISASSNVVPLAGGAAGTAILAATAGRFATLVSDGTNWIIMEAN